MILPFLDQKLFKVNRWGKTSGDITTHTEADIEEVSSLNEADIVSSEGHDGKHVIMLDIDVPAMLVESTTPGHHHLYIGLRLPWEKYGPLLNALADAGVIEDGYRMASLRRGFTAVRLPWVRKETEVQPF